MNCIPVTQGRDRYNPRIYDTTDDDDESVQEFYRAHPCLIEKEKAHQMESVLGNAITMAERNSGSLLCLQQMTEMNAIELGRRISTFQSMKGYQEETKEEIPDLSKMATLTSSHSFQSAASLPTFLKVERGDPAILTQKSWDTISRTDSESEEEREDGTNKKSKAVPITPPRSRSWNKLRKTLSKEEHSARKEQQKSKRAVAGRTSPGRLSNLFSRKKSENQSASQSFAKDRDVEVSLQSEKQRGWGTRLRRRSSKKEPSKDGSSKSTPRYPALETLPLTPSFIPMEISREAEEEDFFLNDRSPPTTDDDVAMVKQEEQKLEDSIQYDDPVSMEEVSIEVMNQGSCFDIVGASNILKGIETSWKELTEDSFDVVPRRQ